MAFMPNFAFSPALTSGNVTIVHELATKGNRENIKFNRTVLCIFTVNKAKGCDCFMEQRKRICHEHE